MKMRALLTAAVMAAILSIIPLNTLASDKADSSAFRFRGYTGGMMLHSGYIQSGRFQLHSGSGTEPVTMQIKGGATGIGGHVKFEVTVPMSPTGPPRPTRTPDGADCSWITSTAARAGCTHS